MLGNLRKQLRQEYLSYFKVQPSFGQKNHCLNYVSKSHISESNRNIPIDKHEYVEVFTSDSTDIYHNLALEQFLFEVDLKVPRLMFWKNTESVIIGKYQNQWQECNMLNLEEDQVPFVRRKTGGGTVYHDLGNMCFSFITPIYGKEIYPLDPRQYNVQILQNAMSSLGVNTGLTYRKDLTVNSHKISGSAYQATMGDKEGKGKKCLHHGTLLLHADLNRLWRYLKPHEKKITSRAQGSVVSKVANLQEYHPQVSEEKLKEALTASFASFFGIEQELVRKIDLQKTVMEKNEFIMKESDIFKSWDWRYSQTPNFENDLNISIPDTQSNLSIKISQGEGKINNQQIKVVVDDWKQFQHKQTNG